MHTHPYINTGAMARSLTGLLFVLLLAACSGGENEPVPPASPASPSSGFTFFDVGATTPYSENLRDSLDRRLGADAVEYRSLIDLEIDERGFLADHFPDLHDLNVRLNSPVGERVEHRTVKLMYRYAVKKGLPFDYVELVFGGTGGTPLYIAIRTRKDVTDVVQSLQQKYGPPQTLPLENGGGKALFWRETRDVFIVTEKPTRGGETEYRMRIYFVGNLEEMIVSEEKERQKREEERNRAGKSAF
jgi:hypothetical protein